MSSDSGRAEPVACDCRMTPCVCDRCAGCNGEPCECVVTDLVFALAPSKRTGHKGVVRRG